MPTLKISGQTDPVVQVIDQHLNEVVYTIRIAGTEWRPKVFKEGPYAIKISHGNKSVTLNNVHSLEEGATKTLNIKL